VGLFPAVFFCFGIQPVRVFAFSVGLHSLACFSSSFLLLLELRYFLGHAFVGFVQPLKLNRCVFEHAEQMDEILFRLMCALFEEDD
jgi:hypothetical protein